MSHPEVFHTIVCYPDGSYYLLHDEFMSMTDDDKIMFNRKYTQLSYLQLINSNVKVYRLSNTHTSLARARNRESTIYKSRYIGKDHVDRSTKGEHFYMTGRRQYRAPDYDFGKGFCVHCDRNRTLRDDLEFNQCPVIMDNPYYGMSENSVDYDSETNHQTVEQYRTEYGDQYGYTNQANSRSRIASNPYYGQTSSRRRTGFIPYHGQTSSRNSYNPDIASLRHRYSHIFRNDDDDTLQRVLNESIENADSRPQSSVRIVGHQRLRPGYINSPKYGIVRRADFPDEPDLNEYNVERTTTKSPENEYQNKPFYERLEGMIKDIADFNLKCDINYKFNGALFEYNITMEDKEITNDDIHKCIICQDDIMPASIGEKENGKYKIVSPCNCSGSGGLMHRSCYNDCIKNQFIQCTICSSNFHNPKNIDKETEKTLSQDYGMNNNSDPDIDNEEIEINTYKSTNCHMDKTYYEKLKAMGFKISAV